MSTTSPKPIPKDEHPKTISIKELHPTLGAEVLGVQWEDDGIISDEQLQELRDTVHKASTTLFPFPLSLFPPSPYPSFFPRDPTKP